MKKKAELTERVILLMTKGMIQQIEDICRTDGITRSEVIREAVRQLLGDLPTQPEQAHLTTLQDIPLPFEGDLV